MRSASQEACSTSGSVQQAQQQQLLQQLLPMALHLLPHFDAQTISNVLYVLASLQHYDQQLIDRLCQAAHDTSSQLLPQHLATCVWSLAKLQIKPVHELLTRILHHSLRRLTTFNAQDLAMMLWGLPRLGTALQPATVCKIAAAVTWRLQEAQPAHMVVMLAGLAKLKYWPSPEWMSHFCMVTGPVLHKLTGYELSMLCWALGAMPMKSALPSRWLGGLEQALIDVVILGHSTQQSLSAADFSMILFGWSQAVGTPLSSSFMDRMYTLTQQSAEHTLAQLQQRRAVAAAEQQPAASSSGQPPLQHQVLADVGYGLNPRLVTVLLASVASLKARPPRQWLSSMLCAAQSHISLGCCPPRELAGMLGALAQMSILPGRGWMQAYTAAVRQQLAMFNPHDLSNTVWALAKLRCDPGQGFWDRFWPVSMQHVDRFLQKDLALVMWSVCRLHDTPPETWVQAVLQAAESAPMTAVQQQRQQKPSRLSRQIQRVSQAVLQEEQRLIQQRQQQQQQQQLLMPLHNQWLPMMHHIQQQSSQQQQQYQQPLATLQQPLATLQQPEQPSRLERLLSRLQLLHARQQSQSKDQHRRPFSGPWSSGSLTLIAYSAANLKAQPDSQWLRGLCQAATALLGQFTTQVCGRMISA